MYRNYENSLLFLQMDGKIELEFARKDLHLWNFCDFWKAFARPLAMR